MMLKTTILIIAGLLAEARAAAVEPLREDNMIPAFKVMVGNTEMSAKTSTPMEAMGPMKAVTDIVAVTSTDATKRAMQGVTMPGLMAIIDPAKLSMPFTSTIGKLPMDFRGTNVTVVMGATMSPDGACELSMNIASMEMNMAMDMSSLKPLSDMLSASISQGFLSFLTNLFKPFIELFYKNAMNVAAKSSPMASDVCKSIVDGTPQSPFSGP